MTKIHAQRELKFINKVGTFTTYLQSSQGDLWQTYTLNGGQYTGITPDYETLQPVLYLVCISSRTSGLTGITGTPEWYFGYIRLNEGNVINASISGKAASSYFELVSPTTGQPYYGLRIKKNIVELTAGSSVTIKAVGTLRISVTGSTDTVQAQAAISITPATANGSHVSILDITDVGGGIVGRSFTFTGEAQTITMKAQTYMGASLLDGTAAQADSNNMTYQWQKISNGAWTDITQSPSRASLAQTLTVSEDDVMTYQQYRCAVYRDSELLGYGTANIMDATDPFAISPNPNPVDETITEEEDTVAYSPKIVSRDSGTVQAALTAEGFYFNYTNSQGVDVTPSGLKNMKATGTGKDDEGNDAHFINNDGTQGAVCNHPVDYNMCLANGDILVSIETVADLHDY